MKQIHELLEMTPEQYEDFIFERYMRWCESKCEKKEKDIQKLIANSKLSAWFMNEFSERENTFLNMVKNTHQFLKPIQIRSVFSNVTIDIYDHYPKPLIDAAQKINLINIINSN